MKALVDGEVNKEYVFVGFSNESENEKYLANLGLVYGTSIRIMSAVNNAQMVIYFQNNRLGIDHNVARGIMIEEKESVGTHELITLNELNAGETGIIKNIIGQNAIRRRLMDMGMTKGTPVKLIKVAPLGDPLELKIRGYQLSLRKAEAELIFIERG